MYTKVQDVVTNGTVDVHGDDLRVKYVVLPKGDVDLWFELVQDDQNSGPYQVYLHF